MHPLEFTRFLYFDYLLLLLIIVSNVRIIFLHCFTFVSCEATVSEILELTNLYMLAMAYLFCCRDICSVAKMRSATQNFGSERVPYKFIDKLISLFNTCDILMGAILTSTTYFSRLHEREKIIFDVVLRLHITLYLERRDKLKPTRRNNCRRILPISVVMFDTRVLATEIKKLDVLEPS